jgi:hypothetical protein
MGSDERRNFRRGVCCPDDVKAPPVPTQEGDRNVLWDIDMMQIIGISPN